MNKKILQELVELSFINNTLNEKTVIEIANRLKRGQLKIYIKALKKRIDDHTVLIEIPFPLTSEELYQIQTIFPNKELIFLKNQSLLLGIKVKQKDMIYDFTLKNRIDRLADFTKTYD